MTDRVCVEKQETKKYVYGEETILSYVIIVYIKIEKWNKIEHGIAFLKVLFI